jgi:hypothetical protein
MSETAVVGCADHLAAFTRKAVLLDEQIGGASAIKKAHAFAHSD